MNCVFQRGYEGAGPANGDYDDDYDDSQDYQNQFFRPTPDGFQHRPSN